MHKCVHRHGSRNCNESQKIIDVSTHIGLHQNALAIYQCAKIQSLTWSAISNTTLLCFLNNAKAFLPSKHMWGTLIISDGTGLEITDSRKEDNSHHMEGDGFISDQPHSARHMAVRKALVRWSL